MEVVLGRSLVVVALAAFALRGRGRAVWGREPRFLLLRGGLGFFALTCFYYAIIHLPLADATVIQYTNPVFTSLLAALVLGEHLRPAELLLALTSLAGVALVARPSFLFGAGAAPLDPLAVLVALGGAVFTAGAYVTVRRLRREEPAVVVFWFALVSVLAAAPAALPGAIAPTARECLLLVGVGCCTHLGQLFLTRGLQRERAGRATAVAYLQVVFAALWGVLFFGEVPDLGTGVGAAVILVSALLVARTHPEGPVAVAAAVPVSPAPEGGAGRESPL
jgi:drug/metabolite transporter (DMT)-like permease